MIIENPFWLVAFSALAILLAVLFFVRIHRRSEPLSTFLLLEKLIEHRSKSMIPIQWRRWIAFVFSILIVALLCLSLSDLRDSPSETFHSDELIILLDRSASMTVLLEGEDTKLDWAKVEINRKLESVPRDVPISLWVFDAREEVLLSQVTDRRKLGSVLRSVESRAIAADTQGAIRAAGRVAELSSKTEIWLVSDRGNGAKVNAEPPAIRLTEVIVPTASAINAGIVACAARAIPLQSGQFEVFAEVVNGSNHDTEVELDLALHVAGLEVQNRSAKLEVGKTERVSFRVNARQGERFELRVSVREGGDGLALDDRVLGVFPPRQAQLINWITPPAGGDPFVAMAAQALTKRGEREFVAYSSSDWPISVTEGEMFLFDGWVPDENIQNPFIAINPSRSVGAFAFQKRENEILIPADPSNYQSHLTLKGLDIEGALFMQTGAIEAENGVDLLQSPIGSFGVAHDGELYRSAMLALRPGGSEEVAFSAMFPLLLGNLIWWVSSKDGDGGKITTLAAGTLAEAKQTASEKGPSEPLELDKIRYYDLADGEVGTGILSRSVSILPLAQELSDRPSSGEGKETLRTVSAPRVRLTLWRTFAALAFVFLLFEWVAFHRFSVC